MLFDRWGVKEKHNEEMTKETDFFRHLMITSFSASADLFIRFFEGQELKVMWAGHQDVVRAVKLLPRESKDADEEKLFISTS